MYQFLGISLYFLVVPAWSQGNNSLRGVVVDDFGVPVPFAVVQLDTSKQIITDIAGQFFVQGLGSPTSITIQAVGFADYSEHVQWSSNLLVEKTFVLETKSEELQETVVEVKTKTTLKKEEAYAVEVILTKELQNHSWFVSRKC